MTSYNKLIIPIITIIILIILLLSCLNKVSYFSAIRSTDNSESDLKLNEGNTIVLIFFADWCGFCQKAKPTFDKLVNDYPNKVQLINDKNKDLLSKYSVKSFPTIMTNTGDTYKSNDRSYEALSDFINNY